MRGFVRGFFRLVGWSGILFFAVVAAVALVQQIWVAAIVCVSLSFLFWLAMRFVLAKLPIVKSEVNGSLAGARSPSKVAAESDFWSQEAAMVPLPSVVDPDLVATCSGLDDEESKLCDNDAGLASEASQGEKRLATERQVDYLKTLGVPVPEGLLIRDASDLIDNALKNRVPATGKERALADYYNIDIGRYESKQKIYKHIYNLLVEKADLADFAGWFVFRVYRSQANRKSDELLDHPGVSPFPEIANELVRDESAFRSLKRYQTSGSFVELRWFGVYTAPDGSQHEGESQRTNAYLFTRNALASRGLLSNGRGNGLGDKSGCLGGVGVLVFVLVSSAILGLHNF